MIFSVFIVCIVLYSMQISSILSGLYLLRNAKDDLDNEIRKTDLFSTLIYMHTEILGTSECNWIWST